MESISDLIAWRVDPITDKDGVMTGCDSQQEWMLPWWHRCFREHNDCKIVFADFGMTKEAREWCESRGEVISVDFPEKYFISKSQIPADKIALWESIYRAERLWSSRKAWFMKPLAMVKTPFLRTIWIDLDCEVKGPIQSVFSVCDEKDGIAAVVEPLPSIEKQQQLGFLKEGQKLYNTGVVVFKRGAFPIKEWAKEALQKNGDYPGNQTLLVQLLSKKKWTVYELESRYNWRMMHGSNPNAVIIHWVSVSGKDKIRQMSNLK